MAWKGRRNKYGVAPKSERTFDGIVFDSKAEGLQYLHLKSLKERGQILDIELQPVFELLPKPNRVTYRADFRVRWHDGRESVIDVKGMETKVFKLKMKMMRHFHPDVDVQLIK